MAKQRSELGITPVTPRMMRQFFSLLVVLAVSSIVGGQVCPHDAGLWGQLKDTAVDVTKPVRRSMDATYNRLDDKKKFGVCAVVGFCASRFAVRTTIKTAKTAGAAYIAFEALEYAGILDEARTPENKALVKRARDYVLKSIDGFRHDIRSNLRPSKVHDRIQKGMKKDKSGTTGLGTGAFLGLVL